MTFASFYYFCVMIDQQTKQLILDTAQIVDVVSDYVTLKRTGASYKGLCPFHNDHKPSFSVSPSKNLCKCFVCGGGGSPVNFVMQIEGLGYYDALRKLAQKYHIEIKERELTDEEKAAQTKREAMMMVNEWACQWFQNQLLETQDGKEIGLSYFKQRGFNEQTIRDFRLGYCPERRDSLYKAAIKQGFNRDLLLELGLCHDDKRGGGFDFFSGRVMFPIFNVSGKVVAFGGRTLKKGDKAKYFNSPESLIYSKRRELYGLYQARREISKQDKCFIVEGYADVISMHQSGFKNVIASSGTALTEQQVTLIHRFSANVTELFDGDDAGLHAAMRGVDMFLKEGINLKVLVLPPEDDPDSFVRSHSSTQVQQYIDENEIDFIRFQATRLQQGARQDPIKRAEAIIEAIKSIALIPDNIMREVYAQECAKIFKIDLNEVRKQLGKFIAKGKKAPVTQPAKPEPPAVDSSNSEQPTKPVKKPQVLSADIHTQERNLIRFIVKYGMFHFCDTSYDDGTVRPTTVARYIANECEIDNMNFTDPVCVKIFNISLDAEDEFYGNFKKQSEEIIQKERQWEKLQLEDLAKNELTLNIIETEEKRIKDEAESRIRQAANEYSRNYLQRILCSHDDDDVRNLSFKLASEEYELSKIHSQRAVIHPEWEELPTRIPSAINAWKNAVVMTEIRDIQRQLKTVGEDGQKDLLERLMQLNVMKQNLSKELGDRVITP